MRFHFILLIVILLFLSGCQTMEGLGKDMKKAGEWVEDKAGK